MVGKFIFLFCCILCALPFLYIEYLVDTANPVSFFSGDDSLKGKIKNVDAYNKEMISLYHKYGFLYVVCGIINMFIPYVGLILLGVLITIGIYIVYKKYLLIMSKYM